MGVFSKIAIGLGTVLGIGVVATAIQAKVNGMTFKDQALTNLARARYLFTKDEELVAEAGGAGNDNGPPV
jgi:hypothetical protein